MVTTSEIKKSIDKKYDELTPSERARVVSGNFWKIADACAHGEDIAGC
jgi:hypothetical protein